MKIERKRHLEKLIALKDNGQVKIITGLRRCGKSFLLNTLYREYLLASGIKASQIIMLDLDDDANMRYRNPLELSTYLRNCIKSKTKRYYVLLDEIQKVQPVPNPYLPEEKIGFIDVLNGIKNLPNVDLYVTGSNSHMLSSDIATEFRGRGDIIALAPLTYAEFYAAFPGDKRHAWREFVTYGGMPRLLSIERHEDKAQYLNDLFHLIYLDDIIERNNLKASADTLEALLHTVASAIGSLTNPLRLSNTFSSLQHKSIKSDTIAAYLDCFADAFILSKAQRYDIKGRTYLDTPHKYYFTDVGLRNALLNFRQQEENHIMENILYNELKVRGLSVDVGVVPCTRTNADGKRERTQLEVDFVVNKPQQRYYIQSALTVADEAKRQQEVQSLNRIGDSYAKYVIVRDDILPWIDGNGVHYIGIEDFLLLHIDNL